MFFYSEIAYYQELWQRNCHWIRDEIMTKTMDIPGDDYDNRDSDSDNKTDRDGGEMRGERKRKRMRGGKKH